MAAHDIAIGARLATAREHGFPNLILLYLSLDEGHRLFMAILDSIKCSTPSLLHTLGGSPNPADLRRSLGLGKLSELKRLYLNEMDSEVAISDEDIEAIASSCRYLEDVELHCHLVTGIAVKALCLGCPLKSLKLVQCPRVSPDAIKWARDRIKNVVVSLINGPSELSGRRVFSD